MTQDGVTHDDTTRNPSRARSHHLRGGRTRDARSDRRALGVEKTEARAALDLLVASYPTDERGIEVRKVAGGWKFYTKPQHHDVVRRFIKSLQPPLAADDAGARNAGGDCVQAAGDGAGN